MKRAVYEKIGGLDERFGLGFFDDDDLAERARRAGFDLAVARDLFVHHFGSRTFGGNGIDAAKLLDENARRFAEKWGLKEAKGKPVMLRPWRGAGTATRQRETGLRQRRDIADTNPKRERGSRSTAGLVFAPNPKRERGSLSTAGLVFAPNPKRERGSLSTADLVLAPDPKRERGFRPLGRASDSSSRRPPGAADRNPRWRCGLVARKPKPRADFGQSAGKATRLPDGGPRPPTGTLAGVSGWLPANRSRSEDLATRPGKRGVFPTAARGRRPEPPLALRVGVTSHQ